MGRNGTNSDSPTRPSAVGFNRQSFAFSRTFRTSSHDEQANNRVELNKYIHSHIQQRLSFEVNYVVRRLEADLK